MFKEERQNPMFKFKDVGDIDIGRPNLGPSTSVAVYRLMQFTIRDVLITKFGVEKSNDIMYTSGKLAGTEFCKNVLDTNLDLDGFISDLQDKLKRFKIGLLRTERVDVERHEYTFTVAEDLDCSGLPVSNETVCNYDEGFISGILGNYTGRDFIVEEVDCWASGGRVCRFEARLA
ncbi:MAG: 4-vinyl reductase [Nitrospirae bacterium]|nr:4-vinyl reductase [Nitrospirota bacterium]